MNNELPLSDFQKKVLEIPENYDVMLSGGRGGAKSHCLAFLALRHAEQYKQKARILYIRQTYRGLSDFEQITLDLFGKLYGKVARYNATEGSWRLPNGAYMELAQMEAVRDYNKFQGRSFSLLLVDEVTQYPDPAMIDRLRSNLRGGADVPIRVVLAGNPGGPGHSWVAQRYIFKDAQHWQPFHEEKSGRNFVNAPSTFLDNPFINQDEYKNQLEASCPSDPELLEAWLIGNWAIARGSYFAGVLDEGRTAIDPIKEIPNQYTKWGDEARKWEHWLAHDYGSSAPSVTYLMLQSPGAEIDGVYYPRNSILIIDELATNEPDSLSQGMGYTIPVLGERIKEMCEKWDVRPEGVCDDACFANHGSGSGSLADEFKKAGVYFTKAQKADRKSGWEIMRRMFQDARKPDKPGLYVSRHCEYFWQTIPYLGRDPRNAEDLDSRQADHAADAVRYGLLRQAREPITAGMINF